MSVYFEIDWDNIVPKGLHATDTATLSVEPTLPFTVQLWVRVIESTNRPTLNFQTIWWFGDTDANTFLALDFMNASKKLRLRRGSGYPSIGSLTSTSAITMDEWHLVTIVVKHANEEGPLLTHEMFIDDEDPDVVTAAVSAPTLTDWDRFAIGRSGRDGVTDPCHCMIEQAAIWSNKALTNAEHDEIYSSTESGFTGLPRSPNVIGGTTPALPSLGWWMLTGHHRHILNVVEGQVDPDLGELGNSGSFGAPNMRPMIETMGDPPPVWTVESPLVYYFKSTPGSFSERPPKKAISRRTPRFTFFQKPELFAPWLTNQGKHPVYDDPNCIIIERCAFNNTNSAGRNPPVFSLLSYTPQTYITNVARRIADWSEYQGLWSGADPRFSDDDPYPGAVFVQAIGLQHDASKNEDTYGTLGLNTNETTPAGSTHFGEGWGIPLQQHPKDSLVAATSPSIPLGDWFVSLYSKNGVDLCRDWSDAFWASLKNELARRKKGGTGPSLAEPGRAIWDYESSPQPEKFCQQDLPTNNDDGNWFFHKCDDGTNTCTMTVARWTATNEYVVQVDDTMGGWAPRSLSYLNTTNHPGTSTPYLRSAVVTTGLRQTANDDFRADIVGWDSPMRQEAVYNSFQAPAESTFPNLQWSNYWDLSADNTDFVAYFRDVKKDFNTPTISRIRTKYSAPILYPPPGDQLLKFSDPAEFANGPRTLTGAFIALTMAMVDACVNAKRPLPLQPWIAGASTEIYQGSGTSNLIYTATQEDLRTILQYCWQRGCDEFNMFVATDTTNDLPDDDQGWNGGVAAQQNGDNDPSEQADFDGTYEEVKALRDHIEFCASERHERVCRTMRHSRRV